MNWPTATTSTRLAIVGLCLLLTHAALLSRTLDEAPARSVPLAAFPYLLGSWRGSPARPLDSRVLEILGVDDYVNRVYEGGTGPAVDLYVGQLAGLGVDNTSAASRLHMARSPTYRWLVKNAGRFGFTPYVYEPWHWEWVSPTGGYAGQ